MSLTAEQTNQVIAEHRRAPTDTGSPEVQIALLSSRIAQLTQHFKTHHKDHSSRRGLLSLVAKRRRLLTYLKVNTPDRYKAVLTKLSIRH